MQIPESVNLARVEGIEPPLPVLETGVLPLYDTRITLKRITQRCYTILKMRFIY